MFKIKDKFINCTIVLGVDIAKEHKFKKRVLKYSDLTQKQILKLINLNILIKGSYLDVSEKQLEKEKA